MYVARRSLPIAVRNSILGFFSAEKGRRQGGDLLGLARRLESVLPGFHTTSCRGASNCTLTASMYEMAVCCVLRRKTLGTDDIKKVVVYIHMAMRL